MNTCAICGGYCRSGICQQCMLELSEIKPEVIRKLASASLRTQKRKPKPKPKDEEVEENATVHQEC